MELIRFEGVTKLYNSSIEALRDMSLSIDKGEFVTLIGPSGCGKTTLLKLINGLIKPNSGKIYIKNKEISQWDPIQLKRSIGYVIQQIGLFPHMTVSQNISYVLDIKKASEDLKMKKARDLITLVGMDEKYLDRYPRELSGGQKQRVGVARALAADPDIILMDEPFGAVDEVTRQVLQDEILNIFSMLKKTIVFVTHDIEESFKLGTRIILLDDGKVEQDGTKEEMLFKPNNEFVKRFFGSKSFTAYLSNLKIKDLSSPVNVEEKALYSRKDSIFINGRSSVMEGVKMIFDNKVKAIWIKDDKGNVIGEFSLNNIIDRK